VEVQRQVELARSLGFATETSLAYDADFARSSPAMRRTSVLPSRLGETLAALPESRFVARAGNGILYYDGEVSPATPAPTSSGPLASRLKKAFDPNGVFPELNS
jgi:hypothetical protein